MSKTRNAKARKSKSRKAKALNAGTVKAATRKAAARKATARRRKPRPAARQSRRPAGQELAELKQRLAEIADLGAAGALLEWDQATYMPAGGAAARGRQGALLRKLAHERSVDSALGRLIDGLEAKADTLPADDAAL